MYYLQSKYIIYNQYALFIPVCIIYYQYALFITNILLIYRAIGIMIRVFANGPGDQGSIPGRVIPKTQKTVLDAALLNTQHNKIWIKSKEREWSSVRYGSRVKKGNGVVPSPTPRCSSY